MTNTLKENLKKLLVEPGSKVSLARDFDASYKHFGKKVSAEMLAADIERLAELQDKLYANNTHALLVIFQALDAAGKDGTIKHVMSGINPQGCQVFSFKQPSAEDLDHDYLWRSFKALPERGRIGIFNRSYYEEVLVARVHPQILQRQQIPDSARKHPWKQRFEQINNFEKYLEANGIHVVKFFLNVSKAEQKRRFLERIERPDKNWKFSASDAKERQHWDEYMEAYEDCFNHTSTEWAPWHIIPADHKPTMRLAVARVLIHVLEGLDLKYPEVTAEQRAELLKAKHLLESEPD